MFDKLLGNLSGNQFQGSSTDTPTYFAPKAALSAYHSEHPIDLALGKYRIARQALHNIKPPGGSKQKAESALSTAVSHQAAGGSRGSSSI